MNNFQLVNCDTDSIMVCKSDGKPFTKDERKIHLQALNGSFPDLINWEEEDYFSKVIILKAKNYIMKNEEGKLIIKGSALKSSKTSIALKEFINEIIISILEDKNDYIEVYNKYLLEIKNVKEINRWAKKITITEKVLNAERTNEQKVLDAIENSDYNEGDKVYCYYAENDELKLAENFNGDYSRTRLIKALFDTSKVFQNILGKEVFKNYSLKRNKKELYEIC